MLAELIQEVEFLFVIWVVLLEVLYFLNKELLVCVLFILSFVIIYVCWIFIDEALRQSCVCYVVREISAFSWESFRVVWSLWTFTIFLCKSFCFSDAMFLWNINMRAIPACGKSYLLTCAYSRLITITHFVSQFTDLIFVILFLIDISDLNLIIIAWINE